MHSCKTAGSAIGEKRCSGDCAPSCRAIGTRHRSHRRVRYLKHSLAARRRGLSLAWLIGNQATRPHQALLKVLRRRHRRDNGEGWMSMAWSRLLSAWRTAAACRTRYRSATRFNCWWPLGTRRRTGRATRAATIHGPMRDRGPPRDWYLVARAATSSPGVGDHPPVPRGPEAAAAAQTARALWEFRRRRSPMIWAGRAAPTSRRLDCESSISRRA